MIDLTGVSIEGLEQVQAIIRDLPEEAQDAAGDAAAQYLIDKFRAYPPKKYVTRRAAYGIPFFTDKQRRWFFAALASGEIDVPYNRTQGLRNSWQVIGDGIDKIVVSETRSAVFTMGDDTQSRHEKMVGWQKVGDIVTRNTAQITRRMAAAIDKAMRKLGAR